MLEVFLGTWMWAAIAFMLVIVLVVPYLAVRTTRDKEGIHRFDFLWRVIALFVLLFVSKFLVFIPFAGIVLSLVLGIVLIYFVYRLIVQRLNDVGWSPWLVYISLVPMVNLLFLVVLCIVPPREGETLAPETG